MNTFRTRTLTFLHEGNVNGTHPYLLYIAYQDKTLAWKADSKNECRYCCKTVSLESVISVFDEGRQDRLMHILISK